VYANSRVSFPASFASVAILESPVSLTINYSASVLLLINAAK